MLLGLTLRRVTRQSHGAIRLSNTRAECGRRRDDAALLAALNTRRSLRCSLLGRLRGRVKPAPGLPGKAQELPFAIGNRDRCQLDGGSACSAATFDECGSALCKKLVRRVVPQ
jgi:hypothetical protein